MIGLRAPARPREAPGNKTRSRETRGDSNLGGLASRVVTQGLVR